MSRESKGYMKRIFYLFGGFENPKHNRRIPTEVEKEFAEFGNDCDCQNGRSKVCRIGAHYTVHGLGVI